ncbi:MAG: vacuolar iron transporter family protein [Actinomycetota bacterium]|jgi:VIT1/CCC1 family predicted Fe2+/Mn2+ transporter/rubrerythrin|nr:vacuolar iron transporter family protein [Actinomycetota bacterium]MEA2591276.1 vacuolar iron transporter family protein [Actinomycetota bacterium]
MGSSETPPPQVPPGLPQDVAKRLLDAWRGEIEARAVYEALAAREKDERRAAVLRKMATGEKAHLERVEARMRELGIPIPDPATVRLSPWQKLQVRVAPMERVLASREAAEKDEIATGYGMPTGDVDTDTLFSSIREDERSHTRSISALTGQVPLASGYGSSTPKKRLDQILSRESWHQRGSGWISGAIYGANDGLAAVFGIVSGVSGATGGSGFVLTAGLAGAIASALSMATGAFLAERSIAEVSHANVEQERREIEENPDEEREEVALYYQLKGLSEEEANEIAEKLSRSREGLLQVLVAEELGGAAGGENPLEAALAAGLSTGLGAMVPVLPFFWLHGTTAVIWAAIVSLVAHFLVGAAKSLVTLRKWWSAGLEMTLAGVIVGGATFLAGLLFHA